MARDGQEDPTDPYSVLSIAPSATSAEVRFAYLQKLREHPPERDPEGFKNVREAYETLRSPRKRAELTLLELRHGEAEIDLDRLSDAPPPQFPERYVEHLLNAIFADLDATLDAEVVRAREAMASEIGGKGDS